MTNLVQHSNHQNVCLSAYFVACILLFSNASAQELLENGSFEVVAAPYLTPDHREREETLQAQNWRSYSGATISEEVSRTGDRAAKISIEGDTQVAEDLSFHLLNRIDNKQVFPGSVLKASCWVLNKELPIPPGNQAVFVIQLFGPDGTQEWVNVRLPSKSPEWQRVEAEIEVPQEFGTDWHAFVGVKIAKDLDWGTIYFDDFEAEVLE